jgi:hypothetical protein
VRCERSLGRAVEIPLPVGKSRAGWDVLSKPHDARGPRAYWMKRTGTFSYKISGLVGTFHLVIRDSIF